MRCGMVLMAVASAAACTPGYQVPPPAPERPPVPVAAPFDRTWDAAVEVFVRRNLRFGTLEKNSGLIVAEPLPVALTDSPKWATCATYSDMFGTKTGYVAGRVEFSVLVRSSVGGSTVLTIAHWINEPVAPGEPAVTCTTRNVWEAALDGDIKSAAERAIP
jgi:hypothetical protein